MCASSHALVQLGVAMVGAAAMLGVAYRLNQRRHDAGDDRSAALLAPTSSPPGELYGAETGHVTV